MIGSRKGRATPRMPVGRPAGSKSAVVAPLGSDSVHISVQKISNGHIITHSGVKDGKYTETKTYSAKPPSLTIAPAKK